MHRFKSGDASLRLPGLDLLPGGSQRDAQGRGRIFGVGPFRDIRAYDLGWRDAPGAFSLRSVREGSPLSLCNGPRLSLPPILSDPFAFHSFNGDLTTGGGWI